MGPVTRAEIVVDLAAIRHNVSRLREVVSAERPVQLMSVVKADGYGHGLVPAARAARRGGADWLGVATLDEALALREAGDTGRLLCWLWVPGEPLAPVLEAGVDVTAYTLAELDQVRQAAGATDRLARVQLKVDTGLSRGGATAEEWPALVRAARKLELSGELRVTGVWSHLAASDEPDHPANDAQEQRFRAALAVATTAGLTPEVRHLGNSAAALLRPSARFDLVRCGIATYGLDPAPGQGIAVGLRPAMTVTARLALTKPVPAGAGVSYGHRWVAPGPTTVGLVPVGYGDGIPRHASPGAKVWVRGRRRAVRGRVCMDQMVVDLERDDAEPGDLAVLFGPGDHGEPTAQDWAEAAGTISYEIVTRVGGRMSRRYVDGGGGGEAGGAR